MNDTTFIWPPHFGQRRWVHFVDPLDQHGPGLAATRNCGGSAVLTLAPWLGGCFRRRLLPHPPRLVGVPAIVANQVRALRRYVLRELGQEVQRPEDLEVPLHSCLCSVSLRIGKGAASMLLGLVDDLRRFPAVVGQRQVVVGLGIETDKAFGIGTAGGNAEGAVTGLDPLAGIGAASFLSTTSVISTKTSL